MDYAILTTELDDDPLERGYAALSDEEAADSLNTANCSVDVNAVSGQDLFEAVVPGEYDALSAAQKDLLHAIIGMGTVLVNGTNTRNALLAMFESGTTTRTNLAALQTTTISRAAELELGRVRAGDVQRARV